MANNRNKNSPLSPKLIEAPKSLSTDVTQELLALHNLSALKETEIANLHIQLKDALDTNTKISLENSRLSLIIARISSIIVKANLPQKFSWWWVLNNVSLIIKLIEDIIQAIRLKDTNVTTA